MVQINQNDTFYANNIRTLKFTVTDADASPVAPLDLTGYTVQWAMSRFLSSGSYGTTAVLKKDNGSVGGVTVTDAVNGKCQVALIGADTASLSGKFYHELEVVDGTGKAVVVATGTLIINKNVSNA